MPLISSYPNADSKGPHDAYSKVRQHRADLQLIWYTNELWGHAWIWKGRWHGSTSQEKTQKSQACRSWCEMVHISWEIQLSGNSQKKNSQRRHIQNTQNTQQLNFQWYENHPVTPRFSWPSPSEFSTESTYHAMRCEPSHTKTYMLFWVFSWEVVPCHLLRFMSASDLRVH